MQHIKKKKSAQQISSVTNIYSLRKQQVRFSDGWKLHLLDGFTHVAVGFTPPGSPDSQLHSATQEKQTLWLSYSNNKSTLHLKWAFTH